MHDAAGRAGGRPLTRWAGVFFTVFAVVSAGLAVSLARDAWTRGPWVATDGVIVSVTKASVKEVDVGYRYRVGGREIGVYERRRKMDELQPERPVTVRYDPDRPERSTTRPPFAEWFSAGVALAGTLVTAAFAAVAFRAARRQRAAARPTGQATPVPPCPQ